MFRRGLKRSDDNIKTLKTKPIQCYLKQNLNSKADLSIRSLHLFHDYNLALFLGDLIYK